MKRVSKNSKTAIMLTMVLAMALIFNACGENSIFDFENDSGEEGSPSSSSVRFSSSSNAMSVDCEETETAIKLCQADIIEIDMIIDYEIYAACMVEKAEDYRKDCTEATLAAYIAACYANCYVNGEGEECDEACQNFTGDFNESCYISEEWCQRYVEEEEMYKLLYSCMVDKGVCEANSDIYACAERYEEECKPQ